jgi:hypothetical protein
MPGESGDGGGGLGMHARVIILSWQEMRSVGTKCQKAVLYFGESQTFHAFLSTTIAIKVVSRSRAQQGILIHPRRINPWRMVNILRFPRPFKSLKLFHGTYLRTATPP